MNKLDCSWKDIKDELPEPDGDYFRYCENQDGLPCFYNNDSKLWYLVGETLLKRQKIIVNKWRYLCGYKK